MSASELSGSDVSNGSKPVLVGLVQRRRLSETKRTSRLEKRKFELECRLLGVERTT